MQMRVSLSIFCFLLLLSITLQASERIDSVGIENNNGKKTIVHRVEARESYYAIARKYNVTPKTVIEANNNKPLQIGTILKVPTDLAYIQNQRVTVTTTPANTNSPAATTATANSVSASQPTITEYRVGPKETLFAIAKKFNSTVDDIKSLNKLNSNTLAAGQIIKVRYGSTTAAGPPASTPVPMPVSKNIPENRNSNSNAVDTGINASDRLKLPPVRYGLRELTEHGIAASISDGSIDGTKMLALHRTAPIGTVVKITNPMSNKSTFAKVVGKFTDNESTRDVIIVITKATAGLLGALDKRFQVNLVYGVPNE